MSQTVFIYALIDPITQQIRYIGKTNHLGKRLVTHVCNATTNVHKKHWIQKLKNQGLRPIIQVIEEVSLDTWRDRERYWISYYRAHTENLLNLDDGGNAGPDIIPPKTRAKMSESHKRRYVEHPEQLEKARSDLHKIDRSNPVLRAKISATHKAKYANGYKVSEEGIKKSADARRGKKRGPLSEGHRAKISERTMGKPKGPMSDESKAKKSAALKDKNRQPKSEEHKAKIAATLKGRPGRLHTAEELAKISANNKGKHSAQARPDERCKKCGIFLRKDGTCVRCAAS